MVIRGIFTNTKLSPERMNSETTVPYIVANECPGLKRGDLVQFVGYDTKFQVIWTYVRSREQENYDGYYGVERVSNSWKPYVGDNLIISDKEHVGESIARIVSNSYGQQTNS